MKAGRLGQPGQDLGVLACWIVVHDQVQLLVLRRLVEAQQLLVPMELISHRQRLAGEHVQCGEQRRHVVTLVFMNHRLVVLERQARLNAVERLNLRLFIAAQYQCVRGRIEVQANDVFELFDEARIVGGLEGLDSMGFKPMGAPDANHGRSADSQVGSQGASAPVSRSCGGLLENDAHHLLHVGASRAVRVASCNNSSRPTARKRARQRAATRRVGVNFLADAIVRHIFGGQQHNASGHLNSRFNTLALGKNPQASIMVGVQYLPGTDLFYISSVIYDVLRQVRFCCSACTSANRSII